MAVTAIAIKTYPHVSTPTPTASPTSFPLFALVHGTYSCIAGHQINLDGPPCDASQNLLGCLPKSPAWSSLRVQKNMPKKNKLHPDTWADLVLIQKQV